MLNIAMHTYKRKKNNLVKYWISVEDRECDRQRAVGILQEYKNKKLGSENTFFLHHLLLFGFVLVLSYWQEKILNLIKFWKEKLI